MINKLKPRSDFSKNILTLVTGTFIAQLIPTVASPVLTRLYTPEDFGILALFVAITSMLGSIATGRFELAIILPKKHEYAVHLVILSLLINTFFSLFLFFSTFIFYDDILNILNINTSSPWLYMIPFSIFLIGSFNSISFFLNREKSYKDLSIANVYKSTLSTFTQLVFGYIKLGSFGLIIGLITGQLVANIKLLLRIKSIFLKEKIKKKKLIALCKRYINFIKFSSISILANTSSQQLINIFISSLHNIQTLGFFSLVQRVLGMPFFLISGAIGRVFLEEATKEKQKTGKSVKSFFIAIKKLSIISFFLFGFLFFTIEEIFVFLFGEEWKTAGMYAKIVIPFYAIRFVSSPLSMVLVIYEKQKTELIINIIIILISISLLFYWKENFLYFLYSYSIILSLIYLLLIFYYYNLAVSPLKK